MESGLAEAGLEAVEGWSEVGSRWGWLYSYNNRIPGPLLEVNPGDTVRIAFRNSLQEATNLHFHGLHVPPTGNADNTFLSIPPGGSFDYEFQVPANHPAGTFWYHPHLHGRAARQVSRGLAGVLVVRGGLDAIPEIAAAPEVFLVLQDFRLDAFGYPRDPSAMERLVGREGDLIVVSGALNPEIPIRRDGWVRLRLVNASSSRFYRLHLEEHPLYLIATDGGCLPAPEPLEEILLAPGERAELMVEGSRPPGAYRLLDLPYDRGGMGMMSSAGSGAQVLATLSYEGEAENRIPLPQRLLSFEPLPPPVNTRRFVLGQGMGMGMMGAGMGFTINGRTFDSARVDTRVRLGTIEDWEFVNPTTMDHPMHIHTNPCQVVEASGSPRPALKDVVLVRAGGRIRVRMQFLDYTGKTFYHCHILDHEDLGMMGVLEVVE